MQELFSKQKGFLEEELDYRKQALDQAYMVWCLKQYDMTLYTEDGQGHSNKNAPIKISLAFINSNTQQGCLQGIMIKNDSGMYRRAT